MMLTSIRTTKAKVKVCKRIQHANRDGEILARLFQHQINCTLRQEALLERKSFQNERGHSLGRHSNPKLVCNNNTASKYMNQKLIQFQEDIDRYII